MAVSKKELQCTIGKNIRDARKACGYTKEFLAEKAEISVEHMSLVRFGKSGEDISFLPSSKALRAKCCSRAPYTLFY